MLSTKLDQFEIHAFGGSNKLLATRQLSEYASTFAGTVVIAMESGMSVDSPSGPELASTHICLVSVRWCKDFKLPIEKKFEVMDVEVLTHKQYEARSSIIPRVSTLRANEVMLPQMMTHTNRPERLEAGYLLGIRRMAPASDKVAMIQSVFLIPEKVRDGGFTVSNITIPATGTLPRSVPFPFRHPRARTDVELAPRSSDPALKKPDDLKWKEHLICDLSRPPRTLQENTDDQLRRLQDDITRPEVARWFHKLYQGSQLTAKEFACKYLTPCTKTAGLTIERLIQSVSTYMNNKERERLDNEARKRQQSG